MSVQPPEPAIPVRDSSRLSARGGYCNSTPRGRVPLWGILQGSPASNRGAPPVFRQQQLLMNQHEIQVKYADRQAHDTIIFWHGACPNADHAAGPLGGTK